MTKIFITGALGALGSNILLELLQTNTSDKIIATDVVQEITNPLLTHLKQSKDNWGDVIDYFLLDITQSESVLKLLNNTKPDFIIHLAANLNVSRSIEFLEQALIVNFLPVIPILKYSYTHKVTRIILTGTCEEYGFNDPPFKEQQSPIPVSPYSWAKTLTAITADFIHRIYELPVVFLRPFTFFGPFQRGNMFIPSLFRAILRNDRVFAMSHGEQLREFNYVCDIAKAYIKALTTPNINGETLNLGRGVGYKLRDVADKIVEITGSPISLQRGVLDYRQKELLSIITDPSKTKKFLEWNTTTTLEEGLKKTCVWYQNHPGYL